MAFNALNNSQDQQTIDRIITRLEKRAQIPTFKKLREDYFNVLASMKGQFAFPVRVLEIGCGTAIILREFKRFVDFECTLTGADLFPHFIEKGQELAKAEEVEIEFITGDCQKLISLNQEYDIIIAHTLISHVSSPTSIVLETKRLLSKNGVFVVFEGDYPTLNYFCDDQIFGRKMNDLLAESTFAQPLVMDNFLKS